MVRLSTAYESQALAGPVSSVAEDVLYPVLESFQPTQRRSLLEFCEQEIVLPDGPRRGHYFSADFMPFTRILLEEAENPRWTRQFWAGPSQGFKTFGGVVMRMIHRLHELGRIVGIGAPTSDMFLSNIWNPKVLPVIVASMERGRLKGFLPRSGKGSRGGNFTSAQMGGGWVYIMGAGGGDSQRVSISIQDLIVTELDQLGTAKEVSKEGTPINQMEARLGAYRGTGDARTFGECVVHAKEDLVWQEVYSVGSGGRIMIRCPHCGTWVWPAREGFIGWQDADNVMQARRRAGWTCTECGTLWSEGDRTAANAEPRLVHKGQSVTKKGTVTGDVPDTNTLGVHWNGMHLAGEMKLMADIAEDEWKAENSGADEDKQAVYWSTWAEPWSPDEDDDPLTASAIAGKQSSWTRGIVPPSASKLTLGIDVHKRYCYWSLRAWEPGASGHQVDYGTFNVLLDEREDQPGRAPEEALYAALMGFLENTAHLGWAGPDDRPRLPDRIGIDSGWATDAIYRVVRDAARLFGAGVVWATKGWGTGGNRTRYVAKKESGPECRKGHHWQATRQRAARLWLFNIDVDFWKGWEHDRWRTPQGSPGAITLPKETRKNDHRTMGNHIISEKWEVEFKPGRGLVGRWVMPRRTANHYLDAGVICDALADYAGIHLEGAKPKPTPAPPNPRKRKEPGGKGRGRYRIGR